MKASVVHWEIAARDATVLREFYAKVFDWTITDAGPSYSLIAPQDGGIGGGIMETSNDKPPYVTVYIEVADLDATLADVRALGGETVVLPTAIDREKMFAMFRDPAGNLVGLLKTR